MDKDQIIHLQAINEELVKILGKIIIFGTFYPSTIELDPGIDGEALGKEAREVFKKALED